MRLWMRLRGFLMVRPITFRGILGGDPFRYLFGLMEGRWVVYAALWTELECVLELVEACFLQVQAIIIITSETMVKFVPKRI